jgi:hypothetical protein
VPDILRGEQRSGNPPPIGKAALIASAGGQRGYADWTNPNHRLRRLLSEFIGMAGLTFILSGGAAVLAKYGGHSLEVWEKALVLSVISGLWLVVAIYFLGDISAHFNPVATLAFALRRDMELGMVIAYWIVQFIAAAGGSLLACAFFGPDVALGNLSTWWIYLLGPAIGAVGAVGVAYVLRGPASAAEATAAEGTPLRRGTGNQETPVSASRTPRTLGRPGCCGSGLSKKLTTCVKIPHLCATGPPRRVTAGGLIVVDRDVLNRFVNPFPVPAAD